MKILVDACLSPEWAGFLGQNGFVATHWSTLGPMQTPDVQLFQVARQLATGFSHTTSTSEPSWLFPGLTARASFKPGFKTSPSGPPGWWWSAPCDSSIAFCRRAASSPFSRGEIAFVFYLSNRPRRTIHPLGRAALTFSEALAKQAQRFCGRKLFYR